MGPREGGAPRDSHQRAMHGLSPCGARECTSLIGADMGVNMSTQHIHEEQGAFWRRTRMWQPPL
eukprot:6025708-Alexandrium_andersonii.AAC.1